MTRRIVIDLFDGSEELDALGPWEVLASWTRSHPEDGWSVDLVTDDGSSRRCAKGLELVPTAAKRDVADADVIVEPGGLGSRGRSADDEHLAWLRAAAERGALITSVCTGALVLAAAGLLRGRPVTTHSSALDELQALDPTITLCSDRRWVDDGAVITAAGVSAGIDMALHLVGRLAGVDRARQVQADIEYHPNPPTWSDTPEKASRPDAARSDPR